MKNMRHWFMVQTSSLVKLFFRYYTDFISFTDVFILICPFLLELSVHIDRGKETKQNGRQIFSLNWSIQKTYVKYCWCYYCCCNFTFNQGLIFYKFNIAISTELASFGQNSFNDLLLFFLRLFLSWILTL